MPYWGSRAVDGFYVHPVTGILHDMQREGRRMLWPRQLAEPARIPVPGMDGWKYQKIDGLWFRVNFITNSDLRSHLERVIIANRSANLKEIAWINEQLDPQCKGIFR